MDRHQHGVKHKMDSGQKARLSAGPKLSKPTRRKPAKKNLGNLAKLAAKKGKDAKVQS